MGGIKFDDLIIEDTDWVALLGLNKLDDVMVVAGIVCCWLHVLVCFATAVGFCVIICHYAVYISMQFSSARRHADVHSCGDYLSLQKLALIAVIYRIKI